MIGWAIMFLIIALIAAVFAFAGIALGHGGARENRILRRDCDVRDRRYRRLDLRPLAAHAVTAAFSAH
jgi:hypothetical protein